MKEFESDPLDFDPMFIRQHAHALDLFIDHEVVSSSGSTKNRTWK
ncbi:hypothetical protein [Corynebacterium pseudotuberculosis]|nr:hypothetical protein [Corynebacterium pseudotuberculosis]WFP67906.1 hypothetical protein P8128_03840 [Corynebacterium pseudotuberculosis]